MHLVQVILQGCTKMANLIYWVIFESNTEYISTKMIKKHVYHKPSTVFAMRILFYYCVEQALAVLPVSQTRAQTVVDTQEVDSLQTRADTSPSGWDKGMRSHLPCNILYKLNLLSNQCLCGRSTNTNIQEIDQMSFIWVLLANIDLRTIPTCF